MAKIIMHGGRTKEAPLKLKTVYRFKGRVVKVTRGTNLFEAGLNVQRNLQINKYGATYAEVLDADTDQLYYNQSRSMSGKLSAPHYEWDPAETVTKFSVNAILKDA
jgi:hypothetical protein